jgi:hypothetical protein
MPRIAIRKYESKVERAAPTMPIEGISRRLINTFEIAAAKLIKVLWCFFS